MRGRPLASDDRPGSTRRPLAASAAGGVGPRARRGVLAVLLVAVAIVAAGRLAAAQAPAEPPRPLSYLTLNVLHGGMWSGLTGEDQQLERRLDIVTEEIRRLDPDVIGLQEASTTRRRGNVAARLAERLGYHHVYAPALFRLYSQRWLNRTIAALLNFTEGPAILSRYPIVRAEEHPVPRCARFFDPRAVVYAEVATPWGRLGVFSTHISGDPCQSEGVAAIVRERRGPLPAVLMGDFNAVEGSPPIRALTEEAAFVDVFRTANPEAPGLTVWQRVDAEVATVRRRVDYLFLVPGAEVPGRVLDSRVVLDAPRRGADGSVLWPSDHYGVIATLEVFAPPSTARMTPETPSGRAAAQPR